MRAACVGRRGEGRFRHLALDFSLDPLPPKVTKVDVRSSAKGDVRRDAPRVSNNRFTELRPSA